MVRKGKVIVAMSGGVDSSVAAAILKKNGFAVIAVFMRFWKQPGIRDENKCCSAEAQMDARRVAAKLKIPFYVIDARKEFKKQVVDYFIQEYRKGRTPNPCVECNKYIKFKFLLDKMSELSADFIATGHYARIKNLKLLVARDKTKDQTYFLWTLSQKQLEKILFPIGDYTKTEVRGLAEKFNLPVFGKKDSQEICFTTNIYEFLKSRIHTNKGPIITNNGGKIGEHRGLIFYTIGQRKGIEVNGGPFYVVDKDFKKNALIVAQGDFNDALYKKEMIVGGVNWINKPSKFPFRCNVKIRYLHKAMPAIISRINTNRGTNNYKCIVKFNQPQRAITPGQSAVFYKGTEVLGGGVIHN